MATQLYKNHAVDFICAREFTYAGKKYKIAQKFDQELAPGRLDQLVRTRNIIPVIDEWADKPRHWYREIQLRENVLRKLNRGDYRKHRETKPWNDEETQRVGPEAGKVTKVGKGREYDRAHDIEPGSFSPWEETADPSETIHRIRAQRIAKEREMADEKNEATFVDGEEQTEPTAVIGETADDAEVEVKQVDAPENVHTERNQKLLAGENPDGEDADVAGGGSDSVQSGRGTADTDDDDDTDDRPHRTAKKGAKKQP